ncbi:kinase-like protein [Suillus weaverae]|nr:kinase-like protein [Suillus weaverae]
MSLTSEPANHIPSSAASTHNLTLTRTATEVVELHVKLADSVPGTRLPKLPIDSAAQPIKRNIFLNTLSRLASPSNKAARTVPTRMASASSITPIISPTHEIGDPFTVTGATGSGGNVVTSLAAYLTTISNEPTFRQARAWKRFVRVRTDDLESVRVERAIKRVRSDLAAHRSSKVATDISSGNISEIEVDGINGAASEVNPNDFAVGDLREEGIKEEEEDAESTPVQVEGLAPVANEALLTAVPEDIVVVDEAVPAVAELTAPNAADEEEIVVSTPVAEVQASRILRSHSADPDKTSRLSRVYTSSTLQDGTNSQTGDDSSISTNTGRRNKRSKSTDPNKELKKRSKRKVVIDDFEMMRVLGKGCAGKVLLVKHKTSSDLYALKAITKRHVLAHQELQHTLTEQAVLKRMAAESKDPFVVKLWWSFHDKENLFLVMDFHPGGDLATQLARWGRLGRDRARFYAAEIVEGVEGLHAAGVIYRDLKPENILIGADGHIVLTDFGLSKEFPRRVAATTAPPTPTRGEFYSAPGSEPATPPWMKGEKSQDLVMGWHGQTVGPMDATTTFCGTAEYLAPEVIQGLPYSYEVDWWSFGTMLYEMLTGITPFWANNHSDMYVRVLQDELQFPEDRAIDQDTKSLIRGLLQRNPALRMCEPRIKRHPYFSMIDWSHVYYKRYIPPYIPPIDPSNASDTQNFDDTFLDMEPVIDDPNDQEQTDTDRDQTDAEPTDGEGEDSNTTPSHSRSPSVHPIDDSVDVFDGYSFKGRHSVILDDDGDDDTSGESEREETDEEEIPDIPSDIVDTPLQLEVEEALPVVDEVTPEPKTPEARLHVLPEEQPAEIVVQPQEGTATLVEEPATPVEEPATPVEEPATPVEEPATPVEEPATLVEPIATSEPTPAPLKESPLPTTPTSPPQEIVPIPPAKDVKPKVTKPAAPRPSAHRGTRNRREKSGVPALDRFLSDGPDEEECTEKEEEDEDWDFIEAGDGEDRNGTKGTSLFARGVVDRYRLAVFRKASTPSQRMGGRSFSGMSKESDVRGTDPAESPSPSEKHRRGRAPALKFRKTPRQFLRAKSPPSSFSTKSGSTAKTLTPSTSATLSSASSGGLLSPSVSGTSSTPMSPSLKSKESATSVGESLSSDQSNGDTIPETFFSPESTRAAHTEEPEKLKNKKLKKYKEGAEKMLSLFASPRQ